MAAISIGERPSLPCEFPRALQARHEIAESRLIKRYRERFHWPLAIGFLLLLIDMLLPERKRQVQPERPQLGGRSKLRPAVAGLLLLALPSTLWASSASALRDYQAGKYAQALREYQKLLARKSDPRLEFNVGAAAYQNQQFEEALKRIDALPGLRSVRVSVATSSDVARRLFERLGFVSYGEESEALCVDGVFHSQHYLTRRVGAPNKAPEPTPGSVTPRASSR